MSRLVLAKHLGYTSLNGRALGRIGAVRAYGLIDGSGDELRISDDAVTALASPDKVNVQYREAMERLAFKSQLFREIKQQYPATLPSEHNLSFWLVQRGFTQDAAGKAAGSFLATMRLVYDEPGTYNSPAELEENPLSPAVQELLDRPATSFVRPPMVREKFDLEEGTVSISVPSILSRESYQDFADRIQILLRGLKRRSDAEEALKE